jgi:hypothetical protein
MISPPHSTTPLHTTVGVSPPTMPGRHLARCSGRGPAGPTRRESPLYDSGAASQPAGPAEALEVPGALSVGRSPVWDFRRELCLVLQGLLCGCRTALQPPAFFRTGRGGVREDGLGRGADSWREVLVGRSEGANSAGNGGALEVLGTRGRRVQ